MSVKIKSEAEPLEIFPAAELQTEGKLTNPLTDPLLLTSQLLTGLGQYVCSLCGDTFGSLAQLARHVQFHDRDRPFPCATCGKRFLSRSHHDEHQRVHTGERPFPCDRCERSFTTHHNRKRHQLIHVKEDVYRCTFCGVLFCQDHQLGNLGGIIHILEQKEHTKQGGLKTKIKLDPEEEEEEQKENVNRYKKQKCQYTSLEDCFHFVKDEESRTSFHSDVSQVSYTKEPSVPEALHRTCPRIKKIAYDMELIL